MSHPIEIKAYIHTTSTKKAHFNHFVHLSSGNPRLHINGWNEGSEVTEVAVSGRHAWMGKYFILWDIVDPRTESNPNPNPNLNLTLNLTLILTLILTWT